MEASRKLELAEKQGNVVRDLHRVELLAEFTKLESDSRYNRGSLLVDSGGDTTTIKDKDACAKPAEAAKKRAEDIATGTVQMNGRELFLHEPRVFDNNLYRG